MIYIIIPYKEKKDQLASYLTSVIPIFKECLEEFRMIIVEQCNTKPLNKGLLLNTAIIHLNLQHDDDIIFHNVEIVPTRSAVLECYKTDVDSKTVLGICSNESGMDGVVKMKKSTFESINGYPTNYWGWGFEGETLRERLNLAGVESIIKYIPNTMLCLANFYIADNAVSVSRKRRLEGQRNETLHKLFCHSNREKKIYTISRSGLNSTHYKVIRHVFMEREPCVELISVDI